MKLIKLLRIDSKAVFPFQVADGLDKSYRRKLQNPSKFLKPYIKQGMTVLDFGCEPASVHSILQVYLVEPAKL